MVSIKLVRLIYSLGLEFWLSLPLLGFLVWVGASLITDHVLSRPYSTATQLQADTQLEVHLSVTVVVIKAEIDKARGLTTVEVKTTDSVLKELDFQFPVTEFKKVESAIAAELGLSVENVRRLVRYQVKS